MAAAIACCRNSFATLSRAAAKSFSSQFRRLGLGRVAPNWTVRAAECERCPLRVIRSGVSYCGSPLLEKIDRDPTTDGCGCPTHAKARLPEEHCPLTRHNRPARRIDDACDCKWCAL